MGGRKVVLRTGQGMGDTSPRVGLVLGAGGVAGGAFHAGVLAALEEATGWDPRQADIVVGTSAGSITGASLRAGLPAADHLARAQDRPISDEGQRVLRRVGPAVRASPLRPVRQARTPAQLAATLASVARHPFATRPWSLLAALLPEGSISTDMISEGIGGLFPDAWPDAPLWVCAVRQSNGRRVVFGRGDLRPPVPAAVAASCAIPGFFRPVVVEGGHYIDGGVHSPTNADLLVDSGVFDLVIVSSPMSRQGRRPRLAVDQAVRAWSGALLDAEVLRLRRHRVPVLAFQPDDDVLAAMGFDAMDPARRASIAGQARVSALRKLARADVMARVEPLRA